MSGKYTDICFAFSVITIPMVLFSIILLYLVFGHRVAESEFRYPELRDPTAQASSGAYFVEVSAPTLVFIASWSSTLALSLVSVVITLYSYSVALGIVKRSEGSDYAGLPTPYQLGILVRLMNGSLGALWSWAKYTFGWRGKRPKVSPELKWTVTVMVSAVSLSLLISLADTWLHVTTKTVQYLQVSPVSTPDRTFGRGLSARCMDWYRPIPNPQGDITPCSISVAASGALLANPSKIFETINNRSSDNRIAMVTIGPTYALLVDPSASRDLDFTASTFAVRTQCELISKKCNLNAAYGASTPFNCPDINFKGDVSAGIGADWRVNFFNSSEAKYNATWSTSINPFYWALASNIEGSNYPLSPNPDVVTPVHGGFATVLFCNTTIYDATYSQVNGSVARIVGPPSNGTIGGIFSAPLNQDSGYGTPHLQAGVRFAAVSKTPREFETTVADVFSQTAAGFASASLDPRLNHQEQLRHNLLIARVPKAPLFTLVVLNLIYALMGIILAIVALGITNESVKDVQARLSVQGLVAERFEQNRLGIPVEKIEELFEEWDGGGSVRASIQRNHYGGWQFNKSEKM
ncbi:MAG: hypothetical protein M1840_007840 [Geoglossum simile]|nr:MAG: hypothetical protein M1840_007840 [Geoglossum simile]